MCVCLLSIVFSSAQETEIAHVHPYHISRDDEMRRHYKNKCRRRKTEWKSHKDEEIIANYFLLRQAKKITRVSMILSFVDSLPLRHNTHPERNGIYTLETSDEFIRSCTSYLFALILLRLMICGNRL